MFDVDRPTWSNRDLARRPHSTQRQRGCAVERLESRTCLSAAPLSTALMATWAPTEIAWAHVSRPVADDLLEQVFVSAVTDAPQAASVRAAVIQSPTSAAWDSGTLDDLFIGTYPQTDFTPVATQWNADFSAAQSTSPIVDPLADDCFSLWNATATESAVPNAGPSGWSALWGACVTLAGTFASWVWYTNERPDDSEPRDPRGWFSGPEKVRVPVRKR